MSGRDRADMVGRLDDGRRALVARKHDTLESVRRVFAACDPDLEVAADRILVDWCVHTDEYKYRHGCDEWCENPATRLVWTARYPDDAAVPS